MRSTDLRSLVTRHTAAFFFFGMSVQHDQKSNTVWELLHVGRGPGGYRLSINPFLPTLSIPLHSTVQRPRVPHRLHHQCISV